MSVTINAAEKTKTPGETAQVVDTTGKRSRRKKKQPEPQPEVQSTAQAERFVSQPGDLTVVEPPPAAETTEQPKAEQSESATVELVLGRHHVFIVGVLPGETSERWIDARECEDFDAATGRIVISRKLALKKKWKMVS